MIQLVSTAKPSWIQTKWLGKKIWKKGEGKLWLSWKKRFRTEECHILKLFLYRTCSFLFQGVCQECSLFHLIRIHPSWGLKVSWFRGSSANSKYMSVEVGVHPYIIHHALNRISEWRLTNQSLFQGFSFLGLKSYKILGRFHNSMIF